MRNVTIKRTILGWLRNVDHDDEFMDFKSHYSGKIGRIGAIQEQ